LILHLSNSVRDELVAWVRAGYPQETCGVLVGRVRNETVAVTRAARAGNMNRKRAHDRFELDPRDFLEADRAARAEGREIVGIWHSHPDHRAEPSETDRLAAWSGWSYLIVPVDRQGVGAMRSWRLVEKHFVEETLEGGPDRS
jgi:proteasome lid subunit RPN8/RPN11